VHPRPEEALCDGAQALTPLQYGEIYEQAVLIHETISKEIPAFV
jgi:3-deoxy-D-arabino-heptulosonate 7-phosphate (DAHP) synthase